MFRKPILTLGLVVAFLASSLLGAPVWAQSSKSAKPDPKKTGPTGPQVYTSANFVVTTDVGPEAAEELLLRLETMVKLVSGYFGKKNTHPIKMYVAENIDAWPEETLAKLDPQGIVKIRRKEGVTLSVSFRSTATGRPVAADSIVYSYADPGVPQHEAVHAYCAQAFGTTGPVWYSEGMAEVGQYWREGDKSVNANPYVIEHLKKGEPKPIKEIVDTPLETTGDSWENYASRWALCHLLGFNENYTQRFKPLGLALLNEQRDASFWGVYGTQAKEIDFEYKLFLKDLETGYRVDLCSWDWKARGKPLKGTTLVKAQVKADRGWQPSRIRVDSGTDYELTYKGDWKVTKDGEKVGPAGDADGKGKLLGILFKDYQLSEPFEIGDAETWTAPGDGDLFIRCQDGWGALSDNSGSVTVSFRLKK